MAPQNGAGGPQPVPGYPCPSPAGAAPQRPATPAGAALAQARRWLLWCWGAVRADGKRTKVPHYVSGGMRGHRIGLDTPEDRAKLATFDEAVAQFHRLHGAYAGLGFALGDGWQGVDLDNVPTNCLSDLANALPSYVELSPSGRGCHAIGYGRPFAALHQNGSGIEAYSAGRFFTFTGRWIRADALCCLAEYAERLGTRHSACAAPAVARMPDRPMTQDDERVMQSFWNARNAERFRALWHGEGLHLYGNDHSAADQALMTQLAFYTDNDEQLVRLFHASALGERDKAWRQDYINRTVAKARATHAPRLAAIAAAMAALPAA